VWTIAENLWNAASVAGRAFSEPWQGAPEQWMMVITGLCVLFMIGFLLYVWRRDGGAVLVQRFRDTPRQIALAQAQRPRQTVGGWLLKLMLWILIGVGMVAYLHRHGQSGG
jgi:predicted DNA repair protein MutK